LRSDVYESPDRPGRRYFARRLAVFALAITAVFLVLVARLYYLQVVRGPSFRMLSEENRVSVARIRAPRGKIFDRYGNVLVANRPSFSVNLIMESVKDLPGTVSMLSEVLGMEVAAVMERVHRAKPYRSFEPVRIMEDASRRQVAVLEASKYEWPGVQIGVEPRRYYPFGTLAAHLLGHVGQVSQAELEAGDGYRTGDYIGKKGVEKVLDGHLKGIEGSLQMEVDSLGREIRVLAMKEPRPGNDVKLTIDLGLQQAVEYTLRDKMGAVVVLDPGTGEILAAASSPSLDPNRFVRGLSRDEWAAVQRDGSHPLQNRILRGQYPPGSVFKIVTAVAALEKGVIDEKTSFNCSGSLRFGKRRYRCWKRGGHGKVDLHRALVESCDVYFYQVGIKVGIDNIAYYAHELGLGRPSGLGLGGESAGIVPSRKWKKEARGEPWFPGETLSAAIGQGYNLVTPLQMAVLAAVLANNGTVYPPVLVRSVTDPDGRKVEERPLPEGRAVDISPRTLERVRDALYGVVNEPRGTGRRAAIKGVAVSGKTGTAQVVRLPRGDERAKLEEVPLRYRDHAWFICYAPRDMGLVAMAIVVEHGGHGGSASAPLAREILLHLKNLGFFQTLAGRKGE
jgi:penicillin-binding protein 2